VVDGCRKITGEAGFFRDWPNVIVSREETITKINQKWDSLGLGTLIPSPSLSYMKLVKGRGASIDKP
jgi:4-hydroxy-3-polyprenylbenzoate decarboxylase